MPPRTLNAPVGSWFSCLTQTSAPTSVESAGYGMSAVGRRCGSIRLRAARTSARSGGFIAATVPQPCGRLRLACPTCPGHAVAIVAVPDVAATLLVTWPGSGPWTFPGTGSRRGSGAVEDVGRNRRVRVAGDDLRERAPVGDPVDGPDLAELRVVRVEEAIPVAQCGELLPPDRELKRAELAAVDVRLRHHADEGVHVVDLAVQRLQACCDRRAPHAADGVLGIADRHRFSRVVPEAQEVEDRRVVAVEPLREALRALPGDVGERLRGLQALRGAKVVVARHAVVSAALDVVRSEVGDLREAVRVRRGLAARTRVGRAGLG